MRVQLPEFLQFKSRLVAIALLCLAGSITELSAQCDRVGKVISVTPGCGAVLVDINNSEQIKAVVGASDLSGGQFVSFTSAPTPLPPGCSANGLPVVALTCVSQVLPCNAEFSYGVVSGNNPARFNFEAITLGGVLLATYSWDFGDGTTATGKSVQHTFAQAGDHTVCLTVSDGNGCSNQTCKTITVGTQPECGFDLLLTAVGLQLYGKLAPKAGYDYELNSVKWFTNKATLPLAETQSFTAPLPTYGYYLVCASYETTNLADGSHCNSTACKDLVVADMNSCIIQDLAVQSAVCVPLNVPVCGCDGQTYQSECAAMSAGLNTWWAGTCPAAYLTPCNANMDVKMLGIDQEGFKASFSNLASGDYIFAQLDFGDGTPFLKTTQWDTVIHHYATGGIYRATLTIWKDENTISNVTRMVATDVGNTNVDNLPAVTDYVMPGDANGDHRANMYDLLNVGVGYYTDGVPRPYANTAWAPQFAPDWEQHVNQVNLKHIDCDGNGSIDDYDANVILDHYAPLDTTDVSTAPGLPKVRVQFDQDTIVINPDAPPTSLEITANLLIGSPAQPALNLYGVAFTMQYPEFVKHDPDILYSSDYFGSLLHVLPLSKDVYSRHQIDFGMVRKNNQPASGYGLLGKMTLRADYIIIVDIVDRAENHAMPLVVPVKGLRAIDADGNIKELAVPVELDTIWIKVLESTTKTEQAALDHTVMLYPNPATESTKLYTGNYDVSKINVINCLGQTVETLHPTGNQHLTTIETDRFESGVYTVQVHTDKGVAEKKLVVQ
jgi:PKD repeat protein